MGVGAIYWYGVLSPAESRDASAREGSRALAKAVLVTQRAGQPS